MEFNVVVPINLRTIVYITSRTWGSAKGGRRTLTGGQHADLRPLSSLDHRHVHNRRNSHLCIYFGNRVIEVNGIEEKWRESVF